MNKSEKNKKKKKEIIYLFNSAYVTLYQRNLLKTIGLPIGCVNRVRYTISRNVPPALLPRHGISSYFRFSINPGRKLVGREGVFVYVDRFATGGYKYIPLRKVKITNVSIEENRIFVYFIVKELISCRDIDKFSARLKDILKNNLPKLTNGDPLNRDDGYYVDIGEDILNEKELFNGCQEGAEWSAAAEKIANTKAYNDFAGERDYLYLKIKGIYDSNDKEVPPRHDMGGTESYYLLKRGANYKLKGYYSYPYNTSPLSNKINILRDDSTIQFQELNPDICFLGGGEKIERNFHIAKTSQRKHTTISFSSSKEKVVYPDIIFKITVSERALWLKVILAVFVISLFDYLHVYGTSWPPSPAIIWSFLKAVSLCYFFKLIGSGFKV